MLSVVTVERPVLWTPWTSLRQKTSSIAQFDQSLADLSEEMHRVLRATGTGVGLAANQVGLTRRLIVLDLPGMPEAMCNPRVLSYGDETKSSPESCLSVPRMCGPVTRYVQIAVGYEDLEGTTHEIQAEGFGAKLLQHEIDHLDGILWIDRVEGDSAIDDCEELLYLPQYSQARKALREEGVLLAEDDVRIFPSTGFTKSCLVPVAEDASSPVLGDQWGRVFAVLISTGPEGPSVLRLSHRADDDKILLRSESAPAATVHLALHLKSDAACDNQTLVTEYLSSRGHFLHL